MFNATFILSTGRCGTQWLAAVLSRHLQARVTHEPLHNAYATGPEPTPAVVRHLGMIRKILKKSDYIECGHPCWSRLPWICQRLANRVRIIHLTRHPVETAYSWLSHGAFIPAILPHQKEKILISPKDKNALFPEYQQAWDGFTPYEKCLYYWLEIHGHAKKWKEALKVPWMRISSEEIFKGQGVDQVIDFLGHGPKPLPAELFSTRIDRYRSLAMSWSEPELIHRHPAVLEMADLLGYTPLEINRTEILKRYYASGPGICPPLNKSD